MNQENKDKWNQMQEPKTSYEKDKVAYNFKRFKEITDFDFNKMIIKKNVGNEARTFNLINQSKPLLSPSRIMKVFNEHIYWNIPNKVLIYPRLMGQLIHKFIELRLMTNKIIKLDRDNLIDYVGNDYTTIIDNWNDEKINLFIEECNHATNNIYNYLNNKKIKILCCEKYVCNNDYHGFIDLIAYQQYSENGSGIKKPMIIDLKITSNEEIINSYYAQLAIYREIYERTAQCYILFYNRNSKEVRLEKASWKQLDDIFEKIDTLNKIFRG